MKKQPQPKDEKGMTHHMQGSNKPNDIYKYTNNPNQYYSYSSAQNLRPYNITKESDSPNKNEPANRNSRKPEFIKNLARGNDDRKREVPQIANKQGFNDPYQK